MKRMTKITTLKAAVLCCCVAGMLGCHPDMWNQPKMTALQQSDFHADGSSARGRVPGTITYDGKRRPWSSPTFEGLTGEATVPSVADTTFWSGKEGDAFMADNYFEITPALLERGQERFNMTCTPCHGYVGDGTGMITQRQRGFPAPPSYHIDRLREVEDGYLFDVMTKGFGRMFSYDARVRPEDRWAIAAYIRALQYSQNADMADLSESDKEALLNPGPAEDSKSESADSDAH